MREMDYPSYPISAGPRLRGEAVFAGTAATLSVFAGLCILGIGRGLMFSPAQGLGAAVVPGSLGAAWPSLATVVSFFIGGWLTSRLSDSGHRSDSVLYGLVTWAVSTLGLLVLLSTPAVNLGTLTETYAGAVVAAHIGLAALCAGLGGLAGGRLYLPVPVERYRWQHRELGRRREPEPEEEEAAAIYPE